METEPFVSFPQEIETAHLKAERLDARHYQVLCHIHEDPDVMATLGGIRSQQKTAEFLRINLEHWEKFGFGI